MKPGGGGVLRRRERSCSCACELRLAMRAAKMRSICAVCLRSDWVEERRRVVVEGVVEEREGVLADAVFERRVRCGRRLWRRRLVLLEGVV